MATNCNHAVVCGVAENVRMNQAGFCTFTVAVPESEKKKNYIPVKVNGFLTDRLKERLKNDMMVVVEGRFEPQKSADGTNYYQVAATSVDVMDGGYFNAVLIQGRLTREAEIRTTAAGTPVASVSVAVDRSYRNKAGEWQTITSFVDVTVWGALTDKLAGFTKGSMLWITGRLTSRKYTDKSGQAQYPVGVTAESILAGGTGKRNVMTEGSDAPKTASAPDHSVASQGMDADTENYYGEDEDLPF